MAQVKFWGLTLALRYAHTCGMRKSDELISTAEAARLAGLNVATVNRLAACGKLPTAHKLPGRTGARLFRRSDVEALAAS